AIGWVTLAVLVGALLTGMLAAQINWGGVFWDEPLMVMLIRALLIFAAAHIAGGWLPWPRLAAILVAAAGLAVIVALRLTPQILHPGNAIGASSSAGIRVTFAVVFALVLVMAAAAVLL